MPRATTSGLNIDQLAIRLGEFLDLLKLVVFGGIEEGVLLGDAWLMAMGVTHGHKPIIGVTHGHVARFCVREDRARELV
jgi:hypothetical protein